MGSNFACFSGFSETNCDPKWIGRAPFGECKATNETIQRLTCTFSGAPAVSGRFLYGEAARILSRVPRSYWTVRTFTFVGGAGAPDVAEPLNTYAPASQAPLAGRVFVARKPPYVVSEASVAVAPEARLDKLIPAPTVPLDADVGE